MKPVAFVIVLGLLCGCTKSAPPAPAALSGGALHLTKDDFYLLGQSWGGILAIEYGDAGRF